MVSKMVYATILHVTRLEFLSVRNGVPDARTASGPQKKGWALPDELKLQAKKKLKLQLGCKPASGWARPKNFLYIYHHPQPPAKCIG